MAITDTRPTAETSAASDASTAPNPGGIAGLLGTGNHTSLGRLYIGVSLAFGLVGLVLAALANVNLFSEGVLPAAHAVQLTILSKYALVLLFTLPLLLGLATLVVPLQVGSATIAFPRAAASAFWTWVLSSLVVLACAVPTDSANARLLGLLGLAGAAAGIALGAVCVVTTVVTMRAPGMGLDRVPFFSWSMVVAGGIWVLTLSVWIANILLIYVDAKYGKPSSFGVAGKEWSQLSWLVSQPAAFMVLIPALGILIDTIATFAHARTPSRGVVMAGIGAFGALAMGAWAQPFFIEQLWSNWLFVAVSALLLLPVLAVLAGMGATMARGKASLASPALLALVGALLVVLAAFAAIVFALGRPWGVQADPTALANLQAIREISSADPATGTPVFQSGVLALVVGAALTAAFAGLFHWGPKISGRRLNEGIGKLLVLVLLGAGLLAGLPLVLLGLGSKFSALGDGLNAFLGASAAGFALGALALVLGGFALLAALGGDRDPADAWGSGTTLEWLTDNPPPVGNFAELPVVTSAEPLLDLAEAGGND